MRQATSSHFFPACWHIRFNDNVFFSSLSSWEMLGIISQTIRWELFFFVLIGVAFFGYLRISIDGISKSIREGQMLGTLEALLVTQTGIPTIIISSSLYSFIFASFKVAVYLLLGVFAFGVNMENANFAGAPYPVSDDYLF